MLADYLTTSEVAAYLRLKERTIYDLVAKKEIPCSRATGKLLFPRALVDRWVESRLELQDPRWTDPPPIVAGSSDPLLEWALRQSGSGLAVLTEGSSAGLVRLAAGGSVAVGLHLCGAAEGAPDGNVAAIEAQVPLFDVALIHWAYREQGLVVRPGNPLGLVDLADAARKKARYVARQAGSGTQVLAQDLLARAGLSLADLAALPRPALTQPDLAAAIRAGEADCGLAIAAVAREAGLDFVPLHRERFDIACRRRAYLEPPLQALFGIARTEMFRDKAAALGGYDAGRTGEVIYNR